MKPRVQVVSPYRPFAPESATHRRLGASFDWVGALRMLADSVERSCGWRTYALTDVDTPLPVPAVRVVTQERRLMLWMLDVAGAFLRSPYFDRDTVMICPDTLVCGDLARYVRGADLGVLVRPEAKFAARPILNTWQVWSVAAKDRLIAFYDAALALARTLPEPLLVWGGDSEPLRRLLAPLGVGTVWRHDLRVRLWPASTLLQSLSGGMMATLDARGAVDRPSCPLLDFKALRKPYMSAAYASLFPREVLA